MTDQWDAGRLDSDLEGVGFDTLAVRAGQHRTPEGEHSEALFLTSSYVFRTAADAAARFAGETPGNVYSRYTNPTVRTFEERMAALEGAEQAVATASGMAAILAIVIGVCLGTFCMAFHANQGPRMGLPQMIQSRAQFGLRGAIVPFTAVVFVYIGFNVFNVILATDAINTVLPISAASQKTDSSRLWSAQYRMLGRSSRSSAFQ